MLHEELRASVVLTESCYAGCSVHAPVALSATAQYKTVRAMVVASLLPGSEQVGRPSGHDAVGRAARGGPELGEGHPELGRQLAYQRQGNSHHAVIVAFNMFNEWPAEPIGGERSGYFKRLSGLDIRFYFGIAQLGKVHPSVRNRA